MTYLRRLLNEDETILFITHRHWFVPFSRSLAEIVMLLLIVAAVAVVPQLFPDIRPDLIVLGAVLLGVFAVTSALIDILRWHTEQFIVTDRRVIQLEGIFSKTVLNSSLEKITDVELRQSWLGRIFDYGDLEILTASEEAVNQMRSLARPLGSSARCKTHRRACTATASDPSAAVTTQPATYRRSSNNWRNCATEGF